MSASPTAEEHLERIRGHVYRLTVNTLALEFVKAGAAGRRRPVTQEPLLTELRNGIRPDQGGTGNGRSTGSRLPLDAAALALYEDISGQIASMFESATEERAQGTPEQLLLEWWHEFEYSHRTEGLSAAQLAMYRSRIARWRHRIEDHFAPPRVVEYPMCPTCGYTHVDLIEDGELTRKKCVTVTVWPDRPNRDPIAECRNCGARWVGMHTKVDVHGVKQLGIDALDDAIADNVEYYGTLEPLILAPPVDRSEIRFHLAPPSGAQVTPCCGLTPGELPLTDRITANPALATCKGEI